MDYSVGFLVFIPLGICSVVAVAIMTERAFALRRKHHVDEDVARAVALRPVSSDQRGPLGRVEPVGPGDREPLVARLRAGDFGVLDLGVDSKPIGEREGGVRVVVPEDTTLAPVGVVGVLMKNSQIHHPVVF